MTVKLMFLGRLEDIAGSEIEIAGAASLDQAVAMLPSELAAAVAEPRIRIAVNGSIITDRACIRLDDGDEVAFLPPVSGG